MWKDGFKSVYNNFGGSLIKSVTQIYGPEIFLWSWG